MHAAYHPAARTGQAVLREAVRVDPGRAHDLPVERTGEEPALVDVRHGTEQQCSGDTRNLINFHDASPGLILARGQPGAGPTLGFSDTKRTCRRGQGAAHWCFTTTVA